MVESMERGAALPDQHFLRAMFGRFASGVTVVTCGAGDAVHGMTANSFTSVSLEPALGLVSLSRNCRMHDRLVAARRFGVSVLAEGHRHVSNHFAGRPVDGYLPAFEERCGVGLLSDALAWMILETEAEHRAGTHTLFVGRLVSCGYRADAHPLIFFGGGYGALSAPASA
ncbi:flavin reductase family protein [Sphingomonas colocasiae]|uniref:Flavin reductase family protein n=1 Tax=Sphingomonas colocasiae TaxID=1848973 RepID=A0ABS7PLU9_9SPHN|nr:flavin reductase family protein [Sphingomonas colocasiae]MBY8821670.1 flavin reductase family protein [Sphingomonas colocasiae]